MTSDQNFLQALRIRPDDPATENWMEWRENDLNALRMSVENCSWLR